MILWGPLWQPHTPPLFCRYVVATCCLFLAGKAEETPKKCRNIIEKVQKLLSPADFETFGVDPREEVMVTERVLLQTLKFDLQVDHPYSCLIKYAKCLKGDQLKLQNMVQGRKRENEPHSRREIRILLIPLLSIRSVFADFFKESVFVVVTVVKKSIFNCGKESQQFKASCRRIYFA